MESPIEQMTLVQLRSYVFEASKAGHIECPCCDSRIKLYRRPLNRGMAISLYWIVSRFLTTKDWIDTRPSKVNPIPRVVVKTHCDFKKLVYWDLIKIEYRDVGEGKKKAGFVLPTEKGMQFVDEKLGVPGHIFISANKLRGFDEKTTVWFSHCLGVGFDYDAIMKEFEEMVTSPERGVQGDFETEE